MPKEIMVRSAADNLYLHRDFHGALSAGIEYVHQRYGAEAVREFLRQFASSFFSPLKADVQRRGLAALKEHFETMYRLEGGTVNVSCTPDELRIEVAACPAVTHMRAHGYAVARLFNETTKTVNETICEGTPFAAELIGYDEQTGRSVQRFFRRTP